VLGRSLALDEDEVRASPDDVVTRFYRRHCDPAGNFSTALASICTYTNGATWRNSRDARAARCGERTRLKRNN
jgi:hypothetical protein